MTYYSYFLFLDEAGVHLNVFQNDAVILLSGHRSKPLAEAEQAGIPPMQDFEDVAYAKQPQRYEMNRVQQPQLGFVVPLHWKQSLPCDVFHYHAITILGCKAHTLARCASQAHTC